MSFPKKSGVVTFERLWTANYRKKSEKSNEPILRKVGEVDDEPDLFPTVVKNSKMVTFGSVKLWVKVKNGWEVTIYPSTVIMGHY